MVMKTELATLTIEEAAKVLGIARQTAYDLAARGGLPGARRLGKRWIVSLKTLNAWLEGRASD
jgi:excisionase family DNA binding protein